MGAENSRYRLGAGQGKQALSNSGGVDIHMPDTAMHLRGSTGEERVVSTVRG